MATITISVDTINANAVDNTSQLNTFGFIRDLLLTNTTISDKFKKNMFYDIEPNIASTSVKLPYIYIGFPSQTGISEETIKQSTTIKDNVIEMKIVLDYTAKDKIQSYSEALIRTIESNEATFEYYGYYRPEINLLSIIPEYISGRQCVTATFNLVLEGVVRR